MKKAKSVKTVRKNVKGKRVFPLLPFLLDLDDREVVIKENSNPSSRDYGKKDTITVKEKALGTRSIPYTPLIPKQVFDDIEETARAQRFGRKILKLTSKPRRKRHVE